MRVDGHGNEYLGLCQKEDCLWNIEYTPSERTPVDDPESPHEHGKGARICNYNSRAIILGLPVPKNCPHKAEVHEMIHIDALTDTNQHMASLNAFIKEKAQEARARLGLRTANSEK